MCAENYKTFDKILMKGIKDLNKWGDLLFVGWKIRHAKEVIFP